MRNRNRPGHLSKGIENDRQPNSWGDGRREIKKGLDVGRVCICCVSADCVKQLAEQQQSIQRFGGWDAIVPTHLFARLKFLLLIRCCFVLFCVVFSSFLRFSLLLALYYYLSCDRTAAVIFDSDISPSQTNSTLLNISLSSRVTVSQINIILDIALRNLEDKL